MGDRRSIQTKLTYDANGGRTARDAASSTARAIHTQKVVGVACVYIASWACAQPVVGNEPSCTSLALAGENCRASLAAGVECDDVKGSRKGLRDGRVPRVEILDRRAVDGAQIQLTQVCCIF